MHIRKAKFFNFTIVDKQGGALLFSAHRWRKGRPGEYKLRVVRVIPCEIKTLLYEGEINN